MVQDNITHLAWLRKKLEGTDDDLLKKKIEALWIFGNCEDDEELSRIYRTQLADRFC